jgi:hypothetical protein
MTDDNDRPVWDAGFALNLIGCEVLVGITYSEASSEWQEQFFGVVEIADPERGIAVRLTPENGSELRWLPPETQNFYKAKPGHYRLRSTGEVVVDPDFTASWTVHGKPSSH